MSFKVINLEFTITDVCDEFTLTNGRLTLGVRHHNQYFGDTYLLFGFCHRNTLFYYTTIVLSSVTICFTGGWPREASNRSKS